IHGSGFELLSPSAKFWKAVRFTIALPIVAEFRHPLVLTFLEGVLYCRNVRFTPSHVAHLDVRGYEREFPYSYTSNSRFTHLRKLSNGMNQVLARHWLRNLPVTTRLKNSRALFFKGMRSQCDNRLCPASSTKNSCCLFSIYNWKLNIHQDYIVIRSGRF